jgi:hypothetical protein
MTNTNDAEDIGRGPESESSEDKGMLKKILNPGMWSCIFTGVLMVFSGLLYEVNNKANETSIATQRAFISFAGPIVVRDIRGNKLKGVNFYYVMSNSGTTPASETDLEWNMSLGPTIPQKGLDFETLPQNERTASVLGPKANFQFKPVYLSVEDMEAVADGKEHLFFWGWVTYRDIFKGTPERLSEFCIDVTSATWTKANHTDPMADLTMVTPPCPVHYCYDQKCEDYTARTK